MHRERNWDWSEFLLQRLPSALSSERRLGVPGFALVAA